MDHGRSRTPAHGGEYGSIGSFDPERMARLEADVETNGEGLKRLEEALKDQKESFNTLKQAVTDDRLALAKMVGEIKGAMRMLGWIWAGGVVIMSAALTILGWILKK